MTFVIETNQFELAGYETEFPEFGKALEAAKAIMAGMEGGWHTCPPSHDGGCKWRFVGEQEWAALGFGPARARWMHRTQATDLWHRERICIREVDANSVAP